MKIGDKLVRIPAVNTLNHEKRPRTLPCEVIYIHPKRRFYVVRFDFPEFGRSFREAYFFPDRLGDLYPRERILKHEKNCDHE